MADVDLLCFFWLRCASKYFFFVVASPFESSFGVVSGVLMPRLYNFVKFDEIFLLQIVSFWLAVWASFILVNDFLLKFFLFNLLNQSLEVFFVLFRKTWFLGDLSLKYFIDRHFFIELISSTTLGTIEIFKIIHIFYRQGPSFFTAALPKLLRRKAAPFFDACINLSSYFHTWQSHFELSESEHPLH